MLQETKIQVSKIKKGGELITHKLEQGVHRISIEVDEKGDLVGASVDISVKFAMIKKLDLCLIRDTE
jgi:hypothetical protein